LADIYPAGRTAQQQQNSVVRCGGSSQPNVISNPDGMDGWPRDGAHGGGKGEGGGGGQDEAAASNSSSSRLRAQGGGMGAQGRRGGIEYMVAVAVLAAPIWDRITLKAAAAAIPLHLPIFKNIEKMVEFLKKTILKIIIISHE
jgi:hypothetical protein